MSLGDLIQSQRTVCDRWGVDYYPTDPGDMLGVSRDVKSGAASINGLRHPSQDGVSGWYIWSGKELCADDDFFVPIHAGHLEEICPEIQKYLGLAPGWRFLVAADYEDVWFDEALFDV